MIEIQAKLLRGPVYFINETIQCLITLKNIPRPENNATNTEIANEMAIGGRKPPSDPIERVCWANVQLHCFCTIDESQIDSNHIINDNLDSRLISHNAGYLKQKRNSVALETFASHDTSFHESLIRGEKGIIIYTSKPKILFCDLELGPHQSQTFIFTETLPADLNPSYSSSRLKYYYKLSVGAQRIGSPIYLLKIPIRILTVEGLATVEHTAVNGIDGVSIEDDDRSCSSANTSFTFDDETKDRGTSLDVALHRIEYLVGHRIPHNFNITSTYGKVAKFFIFKTVYRLGEDIVGLFDFTQGTVKCVRYSVTLQSEETIKEGAATSKSSPVHLNNHNRCQECCLNLDHSPMSLAIPFTVTPSFSNDLVSLRWNLHFNFTINHGSSMPPIVCTENEDGIQMLAPRQLNVQMMTWDFPIKIVATYPAHVAKGFQMASIGTLNI